MRKLSLAMMGLAIAGLMTMVSCRKPNVNNFNTTGEKITFSATIDNGSKTTLSEDKILWSIEDQISINGMEYILASDPGETSGEFVGGDVEADGGKYFASYPYSDTPGYENNGSSVKFNIPANTDNYNTLVGQIPMVAYTKDKGGSLGFKSMVNVLALSLTGTQSLTDIEVSSTEKLSGDFTVTVSNELANPGIPTVADGGTTRTIHFPDALKLDPSVAQRVNVVLPVFDVADSKISIKFIGADGVQIVGPMALKGEDPESFATTPNHRYTMDVVVTLATPKTKPSSVTTTVGCSSEKIYTCGGSVTLEDGAAQVVEYGFVCSQYPIVPTVDDTEHCFKVVGGIESFPVNTTNFTVDITGLTPGQPYNIRAYAIGESGDIVYAPDPEGIKQVTGGDEPKAVGWSNGKSPKKFTVGKASNGDPITVYFSQGNLQYTTTGTHDVAGDGTAPGTWRFAEHQFDLIGSANASASSTYTDWIDLFGWGTSGWNNGNYFYQPYNTSNSISSPYEDNIGYGYGPTDGGGGYEYSLTGDYADADWGVYNAVNAGGSATTGWRTLTNVEWGYLINTRTGASSKWALGTVGDCTPGMIILPDEWTSCPEGCSFSSGVKDYTTNVYTYTQWHDMEVAGAVFLPAAGSRGGTDVGLVGSIGSYWSSSCNYSNSACNLGFRSVYGALQSYYARYFGFSVRLVR